MNEVNAELFYLVRHAKLLPAYFAGEDIMAIWPSSTTVAVNDDGFHPGGCLLTSCASMMSGSFLLTQIVDLVGIENSHVRRHSFLQAGRG